MKFVMKLFARVVAILIGVAVCPGTGAFAQMPPQEQVAILELPPVSPHRIAATSFDGSIMVTPITLIDGDSLKVVGTIRSHCSGCNPKW